MSENDLDKVIMEENLKADHRDAKDDDLVERLNGYIKYYTDMNWHPAIVGKFYKLRSGIIVDLKDIRQKLLQSRQPDEDTAKWMDKVHELEIELAKLRGTQQEKVRITRGEIKILAHKLFTCIPFENKLNYTTITERFEDRLMGEIKSKGIEVVK